MALCDGDTDLSFFRSDPLRVRACRNQSSSSAQFSPVGLNTSLLARGTRRESSCVLEAGGITFARWAEAGFMQLGFIPLNKCVLLDRRCLHCWFLHQSKKWFLSKKESQTREQPKRTCSSLNLRKRRLVLTVSWHGCASAFTESEQRALSHLGVVSS